MKPQAVDGGEAFSIGKAELAELAAAGGPVSLVEQIFMVVADAIQHRRAIPGTRLPSVRQLAESCGISRDTATRAYDKLVAHGLLVSRRGSGFFVRHTPARTTPEKPATQNRFQARGISADSHFRLLLLSPPQALQSRSGVGYLPEDWMNEAGIATALRAVARGNQRSLALPGDPQGYRPLRDQLQLKLHDMGVRADPANIVVTGGAADAISLIVQTFLQTPSEFVLIEQPCQPMLIDRLMANGLDLAPVPRLADGPDLEVLRALCKSRRPRFFFCQSLLHNPTGSNLAPHVAFQVLRIAEEFNLTIVEDDAYGDLQPPTAGTASTRLASLDQLKRVIYVGSFSRTLAPGLRVGYLAASPERIKWLTTYRALNSIAANSLGERIVYRLLSEGNYRHHCEQLRARLADIRPQAASAARRHGLRIEHEPDSGMFLWAELREKVDTFAVAQSLLEQGHLIAPGRLFSPVHSSFVRLNIAQTLGSGVQQALAKMVK